ncbi:4Fe-4S dicluster domain-containing protein [Acetonema longum]|uniref:Ferredoxin n=1 Tax=Acetonema longum DSM 6540 TaxID=1009370 RepID=F7NEE1_9FIRM|nr:4Fe-4S dicluster domain-containing protein [Acetonema longum]EGO65653.1 hypothetical protein ALO_02019 [Acetonema longum DSM 6540]
MFVVTVDQDACNGCGECANACPGGVLKLEGDKSQVVGDDCMGCQSCMLICPVGAIQVDEY